MSLELRHEYGIPIEPPGRTAAESEYLDKSVYDAVNRAVNVSVALLGLILVAPAMIAIAIAIWLSDRRAPVLYCGQRVGRGGKLYTIYKFRTMVPGTEQHVGARLIEKNSSRITTLGRWMRRRKLDELPQLFNVLRGDMHLVGPRPVRPVFLEQLKQRIPGYDRRFLVRPGITGLAQVKGSYYTDPRNKLRYELLYIKRQSLWLDCKILAATLFIMISRLLTVFGLLFLLLAFVVFVPTTFLPSLHVTLLGVRVNVAFLLIACLMCGWLVRNLLQRDFILRRTPVDKYMAGFVIWAVLGAVLNSYPLPNLLGVLYICSGAFFTYFLATQSVERDQTKIRRYMEGLGLITILVSLWGLIQYAAGQGVHEEWLRIVSTPGDPNVLASYLALALPLLLYLRLASNGWRVRLLWSGGILTAGTCAALTFSRSGYIACLVAALVFLFRYHRAAFYAGLAGCVLLVATAELGQSERFSIRQVVTSPHSLRMVQLYASVLGASREHLLMGVGWRNWSVMLEDGTDPEGKSGDERIAVGPVSLPRTLRNMYLTLLVEHGIVGLFFMLMILVTVLKAIYDGSKQLSEPTLRALLWAIFSSGLGFMVNMLFFDPFFFIAVQATFWVLLGLGMGIAIDFGIVSQRRYRLLAFQH